MTSSTSLTADDLTSAAQRILDATIAPASEGGVDAVQMRAIADRALATL